MSRTQPTTLIAGTVDDEVLERLDRIGGTPADLDVCFQAAEAMLAFERWTPAPGKANRRGTARTLRTLDTAADIIARHCGAPAPGDDTAAPMSDAVRRAMALERIATRVADLLRGCSLSEWLSAQQRVKSAARKRAA